MTCQRCGKEATIHLTEKIDGRLREVHLCVACAKSTGVASTPPPKPTDLKSALDLLITKHVGELVSDLARRRCPHCGIKFMEFRIGGRLGCAHDYSVFEPGLRPLLRGTQGATRHVGKAPRRRRVAVSRRLGLRAGLREAIGREDYELAATLRDQLRQEDLDE